MWDNVLNYCSKKNKSIYGKYLTNIIKNYDLKITLRALLIIQISF